MRHRARATNLGCQPRARWLRWRCPALVAVLDIPGSAHAVACGGPLATAADGDAGVAVVDLGDADGPRLVREIPIVPAVQSVVVADLLTGLVLDRIIVTGSMPGGAKDSPPWQAGRNCINLALKRRMTSLWLASTSTPSSRGACMC